MLLPRDVTARILTTLAVWLALAAALGATGVLGRIPIPGPQLLILTITGLVLLSERVVPSLRAWLASVDVRALVGVHLARVLAGGYFLLLVARNELPKALVSAGVGDIVVGILALALLVLVPPSGPRAHTFYLVWNVLGLTDILLVLVTVTRLGLTDPAVIAPFGNLPLALLPLFLVPLVLATHIWLFGFLHRASRGRNRDNPR